MTRWLPFGALVLATGVIAFVAGWQVRGVTETDVIERYAARYLAEAGEGARRTDCLAVPGEGRVWIEVHCKGFIYHASRSGRLVFTSRPEGPQA
ncbi:hypothetical protein [Pseudaestuariivita sp.]|uniref:hypothetical protein n=1 Tax=Pseudaestuariivita sp. TaxID=2211669 RepID=UPI004058EA2C